MPSEEGLAHPKYVQQLGKKKRDDQDNLKRYTRLMANTESLTQKALVLKDRKVEGHSRKA